MKRAATLAAILAALLCSSLAGCGSQEKSNNQTKVSKAKLALMPLPKAELGAGAKDLPLSGDSGVQTNAAAADGANGNVSARTMSRLGRITGYELDYVDSSLGALDTGRGTIEISTGIELYLDDQSAERGLAFWKKDERDTSELEKTGLFATVKQFETANLGDGSFGYTAEIKLEGKHPAHGVDVVFRTGRLLADVSISNGEQETIPRAAALSLARKLELRIEQVLDGKIKGPPVALPSKAKAGPPPNGLDLSALALTSKDLGSGKITKQGYKVDNDFQPVSEYERTMTPGGSFPYVRELVAYYPSPGRASMETSMVAKMFAAKSARKTFGFRLYRPRTVAVHVGDEAYAVIARVQEKKSDPVLDEAFVIFREGNTMLLISIGDSTISSSAVRNLATVAARRAEAGLRAQK